jgi:hypothetical protein
MKRSFYVANILRPLRKTVIEFPPPFFGAGEMKLISIEGGMG